MIPRYLARARRKYQRDMRSIYYRATVLTLGSERALLKSIGVDPSIRSVYFAGIFLREALNPNAPPMAA